MSSPRRVVDGVRARMICARLVRETPSFFVREYTRPPGIRIYHVRESGVSIAIRHSGAEAATLAEVFHRDWYRPPERVARALGSPRAILDLGANIGLFGALGVARWPGARIVGYEPDPGNAEVHEAAISVNAFGERWSLTRAAAGVSGGEVRFAAGRGPSSFVLAPGAADEREITVPMDDVLPAIAASDLVKIDIEGGEWPILADPRFAASPPRVLVLEYHPDGCPGSAPRAEAERMLAGAGMATELIWDREADGLGMLWAWRE